MLVFIIFMVLRFLFLVVHRNWSRALSHVKLILLTSNISNFPICIVLSAKRYFIQLTILVFFVCLKNIEARRYGHVTLSVRSFRFQEEMGRNFSTLCQEMADPKESDSTKCQISAQICISSAQTMDFECSQSTSKIFTLEIFDTEPKSTDTVIFYDDQYSQNTTFHLWIKIYGLVTFGASERRERIPVAIYSTTLNRHVIRPFEGLTGVGPLDNELTLTMDLESTFESGWYFAKERPVLANLNFATLSLKVILECQEHYYGCLCTKFCLSDFRYSCDEETGEKICIKSYYPRNRCDIWCVGSQSHFCNDQGQIVCKQGFAATKNSTCIRIQ